MNALDAYYCLEHGWLAHVLVHECGHAVFALDNDVDFVELTLLPPVGFEATGKTNEFMLGHVLLGGDPPLAWMRERPAVAIDFASIGYIAEIWTFGHYLPDSFAGDVQVIAPHLRDLPTGEVEDLVRLARQRLDRTAETLGPRILALAKHIQGRLGASSGSYEDFDEPLVVSREEILTVLSAKPEST